MSQSSLENVNLIKIRSKKGLLIMIIQKVLKKISARMNSASFSKALSHHPVCLYAGNLGEKTLSTGLPFVGLSLSSIDAHHIRHDMMWDLPVPDNSVDIFQSEDVFEHIDYEELPRIINEIHRVLKPDGLFRLSLPDYRCDLLDQRTKKDSQGNMVFDPDGGGHYENGRVIGGGHVWFPIFENVESLLKNSLFGSDGEFRFLHYYRPDGSFELHSIDYSRGHVDRTPDHDPRVSRPRRPMSIVVDCVKQNNTEMAQ